MTRSILMLCTKYNRTADGPYLTNDLAEAFVRRGDRVVAVLLDWDARDGKPVAEHIGAVTVLRIPPLIVTRFGTVAQRLLKWSLSSYLAMRFVRRHINDDSFDLIVSFAPNLTILAPLRWALRRFKQARSFQFNADFFPFYHRSIGLMPSTALYRAAYAAEARTMRWFDVIGVMTPANEKFLRAHFRLTPAQRVAIVWLWASLSAVALPDRAKARTRFDLPATRRIALFGGQLVEGRGIEDLLDAARIGETVDPDLLFLFVGKGRLRAQIDARIIAGATNVAVRDPLPRAEYLDLASACDVGLLATAAHVAVPTFPTKTIDYLRAGLPIVASIEAISDFDDFVRETGIGTAVPAGDPAAIVVAIRDLLADPVRMAAMAKAAGPALENYFDVDRTADHIIAQVFPEDSRDTP